MKLYHFINEEFGLQSIANQRLKVSTLDNLNDPFELFSIDLSSSREFRDAMRVYKSYLADKTFLLCLSKSWRSPLLWSHYADRHKGMALELEVSEKIIEHITYQKRRIRINEARLKNRGDTTKRLLTTKYIEWAYEDEARIFIPFDKVNYEENLPFYGFNNEIQLKSIILGPLSELNDSGIQAKLPNGVSIQVLRSRMAFREFHVVRNRKHHISKLKCA